MAILFASVIELLGSGNRKRLSLYYVTCIVLHVHLLPLNLVRMSIRDLLHSKKDLWMDLQSSSTPGLFHLRHSLGVISNFLTQSDALKQFSSCCLVLPHSPAPTSTSSSASDVIGKALPRTHAHCTYVNDEIQPESSVRNCRRISGNGRQRRGSFH
jgi:hypothetical protein